MFADSGLPSWEPVSELVQEHRYTLSQLSRACGAEDAEIQSLLDAGVLHGTTQQPLTFDSTAAARARQALQLLRDLQLNAHATVLLMDLLDEIDALRAELALLRPPPMSLVAA